MDTTSSPISSDSDKGESYSQVYGPDELEISLHIDKLTLVLDLPPQLSEGLFEYLWGYTKDPSLLASAGLTRAFGAHSRGYKLSLAGRVPSQNGGGGWSPNNGFLIQVGPKNPSEPPMRLDINPECLNPHGFTHMRKTLAKIILVDWHWVQLARSPARMRRWTRPIEAFVLPPDTATAGRTAQGMLVREIVDPLPLPEKPSLAVLPFQNMSGDPEQEYFADGVVDDVITALSRTGWLFVVARNSSFAYKGKSPDIRVIGRELGVRYVLEGSIRRSANRIRITCQLIEAATGGHVWADRFDGEMEDIFDLQDNMTEAVVGAIEPSLKRAEIARATAKPTERLDAYDLYLRAWPYYNASGREASDTAIVLLRSALEIDPAYVRAKALLASAYATRDAQQFASPGDREMGIALAREILETNTDDPEALCRVGFTISQLAGDFPAAFTTLNHALRLHPNSVLVLNRLAWVHCHANDPEPAVTLWERAMRLSPLDPSMGAMLAGLGTAHLMMQRNGEALPLLQRAVQEAPKFVATHRTLIHALTRLGRLEEARAAAVRLLEIRPDYRVAPASTVRFSLAFTEDRRQAELAAGIPE